MQNNTLLNDIKSEIVQARCEVAFDITAEQHVLAEITALAEAQGGSIVRKLNDVSESAPEEAAGAASYAFSTLEDAKSFLRQLRNGFIEENHWHDLRLEEAEARIEGEPDDDEDDEQGEEENEDDDEDDDF